MYIIYKKTIETDTVGVGAVLILKYRRNFQNFDLFTLLIDPQLLEYSLDFII